MIISEQEQQWIQAARAQVERIDLRDLIASMTSIPSPTGQEGELARWLAEEMAGRGLDGFYQPMDAEQGNAVGRLRGDGTGADLLLYAPIDTLTVGTEEEDLPWAGTELRRDMRAEGLIEGDYVVGLGASNPKGHGAALIAAASAVRAAGVPLRGDVIVGLGAGGMPTNRRPGAARYNAGQGSGCSFMLEQGVWADHALIAKPGWAVHWEEVGLCWFEVVVRGTYSYVGSRHRMAYRNAIVDAGVVAAGLDRFFERYAAAHTRGLVAPQGNIGAIEGGWTRTPSLSPAECRLLVDLRLGPDQDPMSVKREFQAALDGILAENPGMTAESRMILAIPGTATPQDDWIVRAAVAAWEDVEGRPHEPITANSGATDANILRARGLSTARVGMARAGEGAPLPVDFPMGMNVVDVRELEKLTRTLIHTVVTTCTRTRQELENSR